VVFLLALAVAQKECTTEGTDKPQGRLSNDPIYIVRFHDSMPVEELRTHITSVLGHVDQAEYVYQHTIKGYAARLSSTEMKSAEQHPLFLAMELDQPMQAYKDVQGSPHKGLACHIDPLGAGSWGLTRISQPTADSDGQYFMTASNLDPVPVYIIDTGVYVEHNDFANRAKFLWVANNAWQCRDGNGHGTHVASTIGGQRYGIHRGATLYGVKVLSDAGSGTTAGVIAGVDYAAGHVATLQRKAAVGNMSLGGSRSASLNAAVAAARTKGLYMVVAAGNDNSDACNYSPASEPSIITVLATEEGPPDVRSYFSNWGTCVDIGAPGTSITAAWIGGPTRINTISGTSMASPHVAGLAATIIASDPSLTFSKVDEILLGTTGKGLITLACPAIPSGNKCPQTPNLMGWNGCVHNLAL